MIRGLIVDLVAIERADLPRLLEWRNTPSLRRYFREHRELSMTQQERWYESRVLGDPGTVMLAIRRRDDHELLGACGLTYLDWLHRTGELSLYIGWQGAYIDDQGYAEDAARALLRHGFADMGLHRIWAEVYAFDTAKLDLLDRLGFVREGVLRESHFAEGQRWDAHLLSMLVGEHQG